MNDSQKYDRVKRTGSSKAPMRQLVAVIDGGTPETTIETVLRTPINKVERPAEFRMGGMHKPIEQYAFEVDGITYERFADATAIVMKKHGIKLQSDEGHQQYVTKALKILAGAEQARVVDPETLKKPEQKLAA